MIGNRCVYVHKTKDTNEIFYVGKGSLQRATRPEGRNEKWSEIASKRGFNAQIVYRNLTDAVALRMEKKFIKKFGRIDNGTGILTNKTDGGLGMSGVIPTEKRIQSWASFVERRRGMKLSIAQRKEISDRQKNLTQWFGGKVYDGPGRSLQVIDEATGEIYKSIKSAAESVGFTPGRLGNMVRGIYKNKTTMKLLINDNKK